LNLEHDKNLSTF